MRIGVVTGTTSLLMKRAGSGRVVAMQKHAITNTRKPKVADEHASEDYQIDHHDHAP